MARRAYREDEPLQRFSLGSFEGGYNSFSGSKLLIKNSEFPQGAMEVYSDENGSVTKRAGKSRYGVELENNHAIVGIGNLKNSIYNKLLAMCNQTLYHLTSSAKTAITGVTFTADKVCDILNADGKVWIANNTDNLAYSSDGATVTAISSNGNIGRWPIFYNQRLYMTNASNLDRIYYSNPVAIDLSTNPPTYTGLSTTNLFNTDLTATPKKTAGYIILIPNSGVEVTRLIVQNQAGTDYLWAHTKNHGIWRISPNGTNSDGSLIHSVVQFVPSTGTPSGQSVGAAGNDQWFYDRKNANFVTLGEVATYQNSRITPKGGRVKAEITSMAVAAHSKVAFGFFKSKVYFAYMVGTYNDRVEVYDTISNSWSAPYSNWNIGQFMVFEEDDGTQRILTTSSKTTDSYVYEIETGTADGSTAISAKVDSKSTDCGQPGLIKRFAFIDVFYSTVFGVLSYEVFIDEVTSLTGSLQLGNSASAAIGMGSVPMGITPMGAKYPSGTTFASLSQNDSFRIDCGYAAGKKISVRFSNANTGEGFKINGIAIHYLPGSIYETS